MPPTRQPSDATKARDVVADGGVNGFVAHNAFLAVAAADFELRFNQRQDLRARRQKFRNRRNHELQRDETYIDSGKIRQFRKTRWIKSADVGLFDRNNIVTTAQSWMQLAAADIDRVDMPCAVLEQHLGEAAGRCADIEADAAGNIEARSDRLLRQA